MMNPKPSCFASRISLTAASQVAVSLLLAPAFAVCAQSAPAVASKSAVAASAQSSAPASAPADQDANRAIAYYHVALAGVYEDDAISEGQPDQITRAIEEYKTGAQCRSRFGRN